MYEYVYYRCDALQVYGVCYRHVFVIDACYTSVVFVTGVWGVLQVHVVCKLVCDLYCRCMYVIGMWCVLQVCGHCVCVYCRCVLQFVCVAGMWCVLQLCVRHVLQVCGVC